MLNFDIFFRALVARPSPPLLPLSGRATKKEHLFAAP